MRESRGELFTQVCDATVITTNGAWKRNGEAVMGRGCAKQAAQMYPGLALALGRNLANHGNHVHPYKVPGNKILVAFPVKNTSEICLPDGMNVVSHMRKHYKEGDEVPGWACKARMTNIKRSAEELRELTNAMGWEDVVLPRPGCGAGELDWADVRTMLQEILDDRFITITFDLQQRA